MRTRFLFSLLFLVFLSGMVSGVFGPASAEYLNDAWIRERSDAFLAGDDRAVPVGDHLRALFGKLLPDSVNISPDSLTVGARAPVNAAKPYVVESDSMDSANNAVVRTREVPGLRLERYHAIPIEEYAADRLNTALLGTWRSNTKRIPDWASSEKSAAASAADLNFALPVGKRFEHLVGGKSRLDINGSQTITFSGKSEYDEGAVSTSLTKNSSFPSLSMKQEPEFSIRGSVGERITVDIKQEAGSGFSFGGSLEDNISIKYKGAETDIIQNIEAGNTSLNLEGAQFAGYSGSHKGLFGIRAEGRVGPVEFTAIASQEKSESSKKTYKGTAEESTTQIYDYDYKRNTYFFLDMEYRGRFITKRTSLDQIGYLSEDSLAVIEVYEDDGNSNNDLDEATLAYRGTATPMNLDGTASGDAVSGSFHRLKAGTDYYADRSLGYIVFKNRVSDTSTIGVYLKTQGGRECGSLAYTADDATSRMQFKLIKKKNQGPTSDTWELEWKNVYDLGQTNISQDGLSVTIYRDTSEGAKVSTQDGVPLIQILGLDKQGDALGSSPDNKIDLNRSFVSFTRGELIFPLLRPFASGTEVPVGTTVAALSPQVADIYDKSTDTEREEASKYYIEVETSSSQKTIQIDSMSGITEGTERVTVDGQLLTRGTDYNISYSSGEITFLDAISPTSTVEVSFEEQSAAASTQKSLFGLRTEYGFWNGSHVGGVFLFNNESTTEDRVKLGSEPSRTTLFDTDALLNFDAPLLTKAVDALPLVIASEKSTVRFEGEVARSLPNMNTKGEVYIDDFEGTQNTTIGITRTNWTPASAPDISITGGIAMTERGRLQWYNPWERVDSEAIWPDKETASEDNTVYVLNLGYRVAEGSTETKSFAAVMTPLYGTGLDLSNSRYLEIWAKGGKGTLKVDLGSISEDWFPLDNPDGELNTEDVPVVGGVGDGVLTAQEDTGLDGVFDSAEDGYNSATNPDPAGDDFSYKNKDDYSRINGTEGNAEDGDRMGVPDTEDINDNTVLDTETSYYEYSIDFGDPSDPYLVGDTVPAGNTSGWRMFRIPLWNNSEARVGGDEPPDSTLIEFVRLVVTGCDTTLIQIASMEIAENSWLEGGIVDSTETDISGTALDEMRITRANTDENSEYDPPPGVEGSINKTTGIQEMEQSLVIETENLSPGNTAFAYRSFTTKMDFTNYTMLKMFVHGPDDFPLETESSDVELVFRFGADRENYYEYRTPIYRDWAEGNDIEAVFATCTGLKLKRAGVDTANGYYEEVAGAKTYAIYGSPNLQNIKRLTIGIRNRGDEALTAQIWLDELRLDNLRNMTGTAARASIDANLAGFASVAAKIEHRTADFHGMNSTSGSGADATSWSTNTAVNLDRFAPKRWNLQLPVKMSMNQSTSLPRLKSGSDIILTEDQKAEYSSESFGQSYSVSYRKNADPSQKGIMKHLMSWGLEKWNANYSWGENTGHTPLTGSETDRQTQAQFTYNVNPSGRSVSLFSWADQKYPGIAKTLGKLKMGYTPTQLSYDVNYSDKFSLDDATSVSGVADTTKTRVMTERLTFGYDPLANILKYQYSQNKEHDLLLKQETDYSETNRLTLTGPRFGYLTNNYNYTASYTEENNPKYSLSSQIGGREITFQKQFSADASFDWGKLFNTLGKGSGKPSGKSSAPSAPPPPGARGAKPSPETAAPSKAASSKTNSSGLRTTIFRAAGQAISPISVRYSTSENFNYEGVADRPDFGVRFGIGTIPEPEQTTTVTQENSESNSNSVSMETSVRLPLSMGISTSMDMTSRNSNSTSSSSRSEERTLPNINFSWNNVDAKVPFVKKWMKNVSVTSKYSVKNTTQWQDDEPEPVSDRMTRSHSPLVGLNGVMFGGVQSSLSVTKSSEESATLSGTTETITVKDDLGASATFRYNVSPSSGLLRKMNIKSSVDLQATISASESEQQRSIDGSGMATIARSSSWSFKPQADYRFSQKFTGSAMMRIENSKNLANTVHKIREVSISGKMTF